MISISAYALPVVAEPIVRWKKPAYSPGTKPGTYHILLRGVAKKGVKIGLYAEAEVISKADNKLKVYKLSKLRYKKKRLFYFSKKNQRFNIHLEVPEGETRIYLTVIEDGVNSRYRQIISLVDKKLKLEFGGTRYSNECRYCMWFGLGMNILSYQQDPPQNVDVVEYLSSMQPAIALKGRFRVARDWRLRMAYNQLQGEALKSSSVDLLKSKIQWSHLSLEADYRTIAPFLLFGLRFDPALLMGIQYHDMPFLEFVSNRTFKINNIKLLNFSAGGMFFVNLHDRLYYEIYFRLQTAISGQGEVKASGGVAFDGSLGAIYRLSDRWRLGGFWGGQYHSYPYVSEGEEGTYNLVSSRLDFNVAYEF